MVCVIISVFFLSSCSVALALGENTVHALKILALDNDKARKAKGANKLSWRLWLWFIKIHVP